MAESVHKKLERVRKPRVHIKYDVETEGAVVEKELPFVVGVMGDFSGDPTRKLEDLRDRKFVQIEPLKRLQETREKLRELLTKADRSEDLEHLLEDILKDKDALQKLSEEI